MTDGGHVRGLAQVPHPCLAVRVRYLQSDPLYYPVRGIAVYMSGILWLYKLAIRYSSAGFAQGT